MFLFVPRAFDTLAKVLNPSDGSAGESLEATMQLMSGDQSGPVVELEGPILSDCHIPFKVKAPAADLYPHAAIQLSKKEPLLTAHSFTVVIHALLSANLPQLMMPLPVPEYLNVNYICESASRLLFLSMHWARSIPAFQALG